MPLPTITDLARLDNAHLERVIRDALSEGACRPTFQPALRKLLAGELEDLKMAALAATGLSADEIARIARVEPDPVAVDYRGTSSDIDLTSPANDVHLHSKAGT